MRYKRSLPSQQSLSDKDMQVREVLSVWAKTRTQSSYLSTNLSAESLPFQSTHYVQGRGTCSGDEEQYKDLKYKELCWVGGESWRNEDIHHFSN